MTPGHSWLDELDFTVGSPWLRMGVSRVDRSAWLLPPDDEQLARRRDLLDSRRDEVLAVTDAAIPAVEELAVVVANHLDLDDDAFVWDPLDQIGRALCEDFCLMVDVEGDLRLGAAVLCFPAYWRLSEKLGRSLAGLHEPVPGYRDDLESRVGTFMSRLGDDVIYARRNWSIHWTDELFVPTRPEAPRLRLTEAGSVAFMRSERQTLRRLPETRAIAFTIRTQQAPLSAVWERPEVAAGLHAWIAAAPEELVAARCGG